MVASGVFPVTIGEAAYEELEALLALYRHLHPNEAPSTVDDNLQRLWQSMLADENIRYVVAHANGHLISTCALTIIPNLTRGARPYGLIENVVTRPDYRRRGIGTRVLRHALGIAWGKNCYKVMLLTGRQQEATLQFYERAGFVRGEKTGFVARPASP